MKGTRIGLRSSFRGRKKQKGKQLANKNNVQQQKDRVTTGKAGKAGK